MAAIDYQSTLERFGFDTELFVEMAAMFQKDALSRLALLERGVAERSVRAVAQESHALRGIAAAFDARRVVDAAASIESQALVAKELPDRLRMQEMRAAIEEVAAALSVYLTRPEPLRPPISSLPTPHGVGSGVS
ncbi:MAG: hypothetical protein C0483_01415 [Pirellula sp.]|nr:hypothetical protein [Pirellula sp.]